MILKDEFKYLNSFIKLNESEAERCNALRNFLDSRDKILLIDADSLAWWACHKLLTYSQAKELISLHGRIDAEGIILDLLYERFETSVRELTNHIEESFNIVDIEFFFTTCKNNFRKELLPAYKGNRKGYRSPFIKRLVNYAISELSIQGYNVWISNTLEADDLISMKARQLKDKCILASIDKDLKQVPGCHFDYYKVKEYDQTTGEELKYYRGFSYTTETEGKELLFYQLLIGDSTDNIKGCKGIGLKRAESLLKGKKTTSQWIAVCRTYASKHENWKELLKLNLKLMQL